MIIISEQRNLRMKIAMLILGFVLMFTYLFDVYDNAVIGLFLLYFILTKRPISVSISSSELLWIIYILFMLVLGVIRDVDKLDVIKTGGLLLSFLVIRILLENEKGCWERLLISILLVLGFIHCFFVIIETINPAFEHHINDVIGVKTQVDVTVLSFSINKGGITGEAGIAGFCAALFSCIALNEVLRTKGRRIIYIFFSFWGLVALLLTGKRALFLGIIIVLATVLFLFFVVIFRRTRKIFIAILVSAILIVILIQVPALQSNFKRLTSFGLSSREVIWIALIDNFLKNPIIGLGSEKMKQSVYLSAGKAITAHNEYLRVLAEDGIIGFTIWLSALLIPLCSMLLYIRKKRKELAIIIRTNHQLNYSVFYLFVSISWQILILIYSFTGNPLSTKEQIISYFVFVAMGVRAKGKLDEIDINTTGCY